MAQSGWRWPVARLGAALTASVTLVTLFVGALAVRPAAAAPNAPSITNPKTGSAQPNPSVQVSGTADAGAQVGLLDGANVVGGTTANSSGQWTTALTLLAGPHNLTAVEAVNGVESAPSVAVALTVSANQLITNGDFSNPRTARYPPSVNGWTAASTLYPANLTNCGNPDRDPSDPDEATEGEGQLYELPTRSITGYTTVPAAPDGAPQFATLAPSCVLGLKQTVPTVPGGQYVLSFAFMAQPGTTASQNTMSVNWGGTYLAGTNTAGSGLKGGASWTTYQFAVTATATTTSLEFDDTNPVATDSVGDLLVGVSLVPAAVLYPNTSWTTAQALQPNGSTQEPIDFTGESLWYSFPVQPGEQVQVALSNLPADDRIDLYSDISAAYAAYASGTPNLAALGAQTPGAASSNGAFANGAFANGAFANGAFANGAFANGAFANGAFANGAFANGAFANGAFANGAFANGAFANGAFANGAFANGAFAAGYSEAEYNSLLAISSTPGAVNKSVVADTWNNTGNFYVRITGNNGVAAPFQPFTLSITTAAGSCVDAHGIPIQLNTYANDATLIAPQGSNFQTVIVDNSHAMPEAGASFIGTNALSPALQQLASDTSGAVVDVSQSQMVTDLATQAASYPQCPFALDLEAGAIQRIINSYRTSPGNLKYVVIVGDDHVIPFFRYPDFAGFAPESGYQPPLSSASAANVALQTPDYLSDDQYGAASVLNIQGSKVPLPTAAVGRLVETAADILATVNRYIGTQGTPAVQTIKPTSSLVTGYDFMEPPATEVESAFATGLNGGGGTNATLITTDGIAASNTGEPGRGATLPTAGQSWTANDLRTELTGNHYDVAFLGAHATANNLTAADYSTSVTTNEFAAKYAASFSGALVLGPGCHGGYAIDSADAVPYVTDTLAWPQAMSEAGATLIAGTGYQYGDTNYVAYSDQLYVDLAQQLGYKPAGGGAVSIGTALLDAKQEYYSSVDQLNGLHEKAVGQVELYGLPMIGILEPTQVSAPAGPVSVVPTAPAVGTAPGNQLGLASASLDVKPQLAGKNVVPTGSQAPYGYISGPQGVVADPGGPVLPVQTEDVNVSGETLRGVGFTGGTYTDTTATNPLLTGDPVTETSNSSIAPFSSQVFVPATMWNPNYFSTLLNGGDTDLSFNPVQYRSIRGGATPDVRQYTDLQVQLYYSNNTATYGVNTPALASPPAITNVTSTISGSTVTVSAHVTGALSAGIQDVWVTYTGSVAPLSGTWQSVHLTQSNVDSTLWTGSFTDPNSPNPGADANFVVQAVNGVGEVTLDDNNGSYFIPGVTAGLATAAAPNTYTLQLGGDTSGTYSGTASFTAKLAAVAGDPSPNVANQPVTFALGGSSVTVLTDGSGNASTQMAVFAQPGAYSVTASFPGDSQDGAVATTGPFTVGAASTTLVLTAPNPPQFIPGQDSGVTATLSAAGQPLPSETVFFVLTSPGGAVVGTSSGVTDSNGVAHAGVISLIGNPNGPGYTLTAYFASNAVPLPGGASFNASNPDYTPASASTAITVFVDQDLGITQGVSPPTAQAASSAGAAVTFTPPTATDEAGDNPPPVVTCDHASGSVFPVGQTLVTCKATDNDDTPSTVSTTLTVTVEGVAGQLQDLLAYVESSALPPGNSFIGQVSIAIGDYNAVPPNITGVCTTLTSVISHAKAQSGKQITAASATVILGYATRIRGALNCP